jgi:hypothetical protein
MLQLRFTGSVTDKLNGSLYTAAIFVDMSKVRDTVWTTGLMHRIHTAGMSDSITLLLVSYLTECNFRVKMGGNFPNGSQYVQAYPRAPF